MSRMGGERVPIREPNQVAGTRSCAWTPTTSLGYAGTMGGRTSSLSNVAEASRGALTLSKLGAGWPAEGAIKIGTGTAPVRVYVGLVGESHRGRDDERRFQNPSTKKPIEPKDGAITLLLGVWRPDTKDPVVVGMDAYRRVGLETRFSMFMPAALLEEAADTGYAEHATQSGETLIAFKASRFADYLAKVVDTRSAGLKWSEKDFGGSVPESVRTKVGVAALEADGSIHIRPKVGMYAAFARLNYKSWFAIAEFVDNAVQSYTSHRKQLGKAPLQVDIRFDEDEIVITDRAAGIAAHELPRAFSPSTPPPDATGLSEFGLGMKAAACWFSRYWTVRTSAIDDPAERFIRFDVDRITAEGVEHLPIEVRPANEDAHFTVVTLRNLRVRPQGRSIAKIKEHLAAMYRVLMDSGFVQIRVTTATSSEDLKYERPPLLKAPFFREPDEEPREWRKDFTFNFPGKKRVWGWAGLLERGSGSHAGLSVFRRGRLIQGSADETYRPLRLFRNPNSYTYQRLVGELFVDGFDVSHTKDGIQWGGLEEEVISRLHADLSTPEMPLLAQAEGYRVRQKARELPAGFGGEALEAAAAQLKSSKPVDLNAPLPPPPSEPEPVAAPIHKDSIHKTQKIVISDPVETVELKLDLVQDPAREWYGFSQASQEGHHQIEVWINLAHPFSESFVNSDENTIAPLVRVVTALVMAERGALQVGIKRAAQIRQRVNEILRGFGHEIEDRLGGVK